jgi:hypothetical protein
VNGVSRFGVIPAAVCAVLMMVAGCGSSAVGPSGGTGARFTPANSTAAGGSSVPTVPPQPAPAVRAGFADNGRTVQLAPGQRLQVTLDSTYWMFTLVAQGVLLVRTAPKVQPAASCVPGGGCGTVTESLVAIGRGNAEVTAHRTVCGEAMGCTAKASRFVLHVVVK